MMSLIGHREKGLVMINQEYLPLAEYSSKYRVSISTLRRRIKSEEIPFEFKEGKYYLLDQPVSTHQRIHRPSLSIREDSLMGAQKTSLRFDDSSLDTEEDGSKSEPILATANRLLTELKKAYTQILQEKEDLILHLREEVSDLRTLARVLEEENERLKKSRSKNVES